MNDRNDIAVIGMGCMFPGAENLEEFWNVLVNGEDHVKDIPLERFNVQAFYDPDPDHPFKTYVKQAGLIKRYDEWDNQFFGISDMEAELVDPQQHFVLESVHMAFEDAGISKEKLFGSDTGVYIGAMNPDWGSVLRSSRHKSTNTTVTAIDLSIISARVAYFYNLLGPAITINTACSSAMTAFHAASQALKNGEISMAIAGGVNFILDPETFVHLSSARMASPTGKCHTFSESADGYARGEGCGIVIMKRLADAVRDKNKIWGTIFTGLNQDGHMSSPITSPSGDQQTKLIETVFERCKIPPHQVQYIEAHGTGTPVGDFTEVSALGTFFREHVPHDIPLGSVKPNIGHLESGAGAASLIKVLLMMKNGKFVPSVHSEPLNSKIPFKELKLKVCREESAWLKNGHSRRIASINCFGFGGTNAHAVVCDYKEDEIPYTPNIVHSCLRLKSFVIVSANDLKALQSTARHLMDSLKQTDISLVDLSSTSVHSRGHYRFRKVFAVDELKELSYEIGKFDKDQMPIKAIGKEKPKVVFVYCGVGTTWQKMCKYFITYDKIFRQTLQEIDHCLSTYTNISVQSIFVNEEDMSDPLKNHLAIFACQIGLTEMWKYVGVYPDSIVGQSVGEVAAAYACNVLSLKDAVKVIYFRSLHLANESAGKMIMIQNCNMEVIEEQCSKLQNGQANIAVYHSPASCAVSGDSTAIIELQTKLSKHPLKITPLNVKCAYHSHITKNAGFQLEKSLQDLKHEKPSTTVISTVTGKQASNQFGSPKYWSKNVSNPVLFHDAIKESRQGNANTVFLEIGPNPVLKAHVPNIFPEPFPDALPSIKRKSEMETFQATFINLFERGVPVKWEHVVQNTNTVLRIPEYQFNKRKHLSASENIKNTLKGYRNTDNMMLLSQVPGKEDQFTMRISRENTAFIFEHVVDGSVVVPGALYGELALEIGNMKIQDNVSSDFNVSWTLSKALLVTSNEHVITVKTKHETKQVLSFEIFTSETSSPLSSGRVTLAPTPKSYNIDVSRMISILEADGDPFMTYIALKDLGFQYGPMFKTIKKIAVRNKEIICEVFIPDLIMKEVQRTYLHPVVIDTMLQSTVGTQLRNNNLSKERALPVKISHLVVRQRPRQRMLCYTILAKNNATTSSFDMRLIDTNGNIIAEIGGFEVEKINLPESIQSVAFYETWKSFDLQTLSRNPSCGLKKDIAVFSWNKEYLFLIENAFNKNKENVNVWHTLLTRESSSELSCLGKQIKEQNMCVIFAPGVDGISEDTKGEQLFDSISQITSAFLTILKALFKNEIHIIVITNETQPCSVNNIKVIGAELWGMVRSVAQEGTALAFTLLDIDRLSDFVLDSVIQIATLINSKGMYPPPEYAVRGNMMFKNEILKMPEIFYKRSEKRSFQTTSQCVRICQHSHQNGGNFFGIPSLEVESNRPKVVHVWPNQVLRCNSDYFLTIKDDSHFDLLGTQITENEIRICEVAGKAKIGNEDIEVVACCNTALKTKISFDKKCVFKKSIFKNYKTGYLHAVIIAQTMSDLIQKKTHVAVVYSKTYYTIYHFLCLLLKKKKCDIYSEEHSVGRKIQNGLITDIIILANSDYVPKSVLQIQFPKLQRCVALKGTLKKRKENGLIQFQEVDVEDLYQTSKLLLASKRACSFLSSVLNRCQEPEFDDKLPVLNITEIKRHLELRTNEETLIKNDGAYIVVGGLTGLGWLITKYLSKKRPKKIVTLSRRSPSMEVEQRIRNVMNVYDVEITHREVDITKLNDLKKVMQSIQQSMPDTPIRGVFQGAAVVKDNPVQKITQEEFELPLRAKILGTWNLHLVTKHMNLDIFIMHSSATSVFGNYSQTNYAAANSFQDSFAHYRKTLGYSAQTINWGALNVGLGSDAALRDIFLHKGFGLLTEKQICNCLTQMLLSDRTQAIFADFHLEQFLAANNVRWHNSKFAELVTQDDIVSPVAESIERVGNMVADGNMTHLLKQISAQVLLLDILEIGDTDNLAQFGIDSQNGIEIINTIYSRTNVRIPILMLLSGAFTFMELGAYITERLELEGTSVEQNGEHERETNFDDKKFKCIRDNNTTLGFSFEISPIMNKADLWKKIMHIMLRINSTIIANVNEDSGISEETDLCVEDFILTFIHAHEKDSLSTIVDNVNKTLFVVYVDRNEKAILNIFGRRSHFDAFCGSIISRDLQTISEYVVAKQTIPEWLDKFNIDVNSLGTNRLRTIHKESKEYWKSRLILCKKSSSLEAMSSVFHKNEQNAKINLPSIDTKGLKSYALENGLTVCSLIASAYQFMLHIVTNAERVPIVMEIDLRSQIPECSKHISPCSNFIPIISPCFSPSNASIRHFLIENNEIMKDGFSHGIFPYSSIEDLQEFVKQIHETHFFLFHEVSDHHPYINMGSVSVLSTTCFMLPGFHHGRLSLLPNQTFETNIRKDSYPLTNAFIVR